ncbi:MAG: Transcription regulator ArsR [Candidatus Moranbacteria bacterium GW2011_GWC2_37_73]|nr:MAG: Transcription regulator ArsR [Parcubacteria group bacterium GW2011_GWC1_36_108]KKQ01183.1 MAG: Transcription regulator ArsR [Candidatus Moranbacteria bacterium GW2011_GWD1_36_198]KKQ02384.1 MAG: Transcription regulator ArsR [Candidatus Moranbacteria bacterium GW2011_GWD2_36_198]KKQ40083.1 MAG: Transcription regulator ArsR [Candidatus Moranbacteria bacterium GW2011_GWC2_37_73]MDD5464113.1 metalloregulator ArsR/SmtB family transcription factor [Candidatus Moranbacteria bacterium]
MKKAVKKIGKQPDKQFLEVNKFLKIVSDENRLRILVLLEKGSLNVTDIHSKLKLPQNLTSHHISKLKSVDLLVEKREGTFRHYSVNAKKIKEYNQMFLKLMNV